jgi:hypothetical protein
MNCFCLAYPGYELYAMHICLAYSPVYIAIPADMQVTEHNPLSGNCVGNHGETDENKNAIVRVFVRKNGFERRGMSRVPDGAGNRQRVSGNTG